MDPRPIRESRREMSARPPAAPPPTIGSQRMISFQISFGCSSKKSLGISERSDSLLGGRSWTYNTPGALGWWINYREAIGAIVPRHSHRYKRGALAMKRQWRSFRIFLLTNRGTQADY